MKLKPHLNPRKIGDEYMLPAGNGDSVDYTRVITFNPSAAYLLEHTQGEFTVEEWAELLVQRYDIDKAQALNDVRALVDSLQKAGLLVEE